MTNPQRQFVWLLMAFVAASLILDLASLIR